MPNLAARLFLEIAVILVACRAAAWLGRRALQPPVVCEMAAGILLGPSLLGWLSPSLQAFLFPPETAPIVFAVSQLGLALYMFVVGLEFRLDLLTAGWRGSAAVSLAGVLVPLSLGALLGARLIGDPAFFGSGVKPWHAALFMGAAMSITAFPMLARIILERGIGGSRIGTLSLGAGAFDDAAAWTLLAAVLAAFESRPGLLAWAVGGGAAYVALMAWVVKPWSQALVDRRPDAAAGPRGLAFALVLLMLAAAYADLIGLHAVFGAFLLGAAMPRGAFADALRDKIEPLTSSLLIPLFFAFSGLNTRLDLLAAPGMWATALAVLLIATVGKGGACALTARLAGYSRAEAFAVGALMNARGLMELIILNIGLERGLVTPTLFSIMVLMTLATTLAASPLFELARPFLSFPDRSSNPTGTAEAARDGGASLGPGR